MSSDEQPNASNNSFLAVLLALLMGGGIFTYLVVITGGFFLYVLAAAVGLGFFGYLHYLLWGRSLSRSVTEEPAEEAFPDETSQGEWPREGPSEPHRL